MNFADVVIGNTVYAVNRPPNNQEDLVTGTVLEKKESAGSQIIVVGDNSQGMGFIMTYSIPVADVYALRSDAVDALEDIYDADAATKTAYIVTLRA
jgi:hypothetical protein